MKLKNFNYSFTIIPTLGDGNCLIHAALGCCNSKYLNSNKKEKSNIALQLRKDLADLLDIKIKDKTFYQNLSRGQLEEISQHVHEVKKEYMQSYLRSQQWLTAVYLELLSTVLNINIVLISAKERDFYHTGDKEIFFQYRHTIFINYIDQLHFESMGIHTKDGLKTLFHRDGEIIKSLKKIL